MHIPTQSNNNQYHYGHYIKNSQNKNHQKVKKEQNFLHEFIEADQIEQNDYQNDRQYYKIDNQTFRAHNIQNQSRVTTIKSDLNKSRNNSHNRKISNHQTTNKKINQPYIYGNQSQISENRQNISQFQGLSSNCLANPSYYIPITSNFLTLKQKSYSKNNEIDQRDSLNNQHKDQLNPTITSSVYPALSPTQTPSIFNPYSDSQFQCQLISSIQYKKMEQILNSKNITLQNQNQYLKNQIRNLYRKEQETKISYRQRIKLLKKQRKIYQLQYQELKKYVLEIILKIMKISQKQLEIKNSVIWSEKNNNNVKNNDKNNQTRYEQSGQFNNECQQIIFNCSKELIEKLNQDLISFDEKDQENIELENQWECSFSDIEDIDMKKRQKYKPDQTKSKQGSSKRIATQISSSITPRNQVIRNQHHERSLKSTEKNTTRDNKQKPQNNHLPPPYPKISQFIPEYTKMRPFSYQDNSPSKNNTNKNSCSLLFGQSNQIDPIRQYHLRKDYNDKVFNEETSQSTQCPNINQQIDELTDQTEALMYQLRKTDNKDSEIKKKIIKITQKIRQLKMQKDQNQEKVKEFQNLLHIKK